MDLVAVDRASETRDAFTRLRATLRRGAVRYRRNVGYQGGSVDYDVYWRPADGYWSLFHPNQTENRYWCCYGTVDPEPVTSLSITCEINPPKRGVDRRIAGMFVKDAAGNVYVTHSGKIGGGREGIGMEGFYEHYKGQDSVLPVRMPDGSTRRMVVIGRVNGGNLPAHLGLFVHEVERIKHVLSQSAEGDDVTGHAHADFTPEFVGKKQYTLKGEIEALCDHGLVVQALADALEGLTDKVGNDQNRDLFTLQGGQVTALFEVKTDLATTSLYCAVGQLMLHGAVHAPPPRRVLVLPGEPSTATRTALGMLGIEVAIYGWKGTTPVLPDVSEFVK